MDIEFSTFVYQYPIEWKTKKTKIQTRSEIKTMDQTYQGLGQPIEDQPESVKAKRHTRPHTAMTQQEVQYAMANLESTHLLMASIPFDRLIKADS